MTRAKRPAPQVSRVRWIARVGAAAVLLLALGVGPTAADAESAASPATEASPGSPSALGPPPPMPTIRFSRGSEACDHPDMAHHPRCHQWRQAYARWRQAHEAEGKD